MVKEIMTPEQLLAQQTAKIEAFNDACVAKLESHYVDGKTAVDVSTEEHEAWVVAHVVKALTGKNWRVVAGENQISILKGEPASELDEIGTIDTAPGGKDLTISAGPHTESIGKWTPGNLPPTAGPQLVSTTADDPAGVKIQMGEITDHVKAAIVERPAHDEGRLMSRPPEDLVETAKPVEPYGERSLDGEEPVKAPAAAPVAPVKRLHTRIDIDRMLGRARYGASAKTISMNDSFRNLLGTAVEACSSRDTQVVQQPGYHSLIAAAKHAFDNHYGLELSPDVLWVTIVQGLAQHVNADPEKWRKVFVAHEGKEIIRITRNGFTLGNPDNDWAGCFPEFSDKIAEHIGEETQRLIVSDFSTTGPLEKVVSEIALMDVVQAYFDYRTQTLCGIPYVMLKGTTEDWQKLQAKVEQLGAKYPDLNWWLATLKPILTELVDASKNGRGDTDFWKSLYKWDSTSGGDKVNGWLLRFLPFTKDWRDKTKLMKNPLVDEYRPSRPGWSRRSDDSGAINSNIIPRSISLVPFIWEYMGSNLNYEFIGGVVAYDRDEKDLVRPQLGWAVRPAPTK